MSYQVTLSPRAEEDLTEIFDWTRRHFGEDQEENYRELLALAIEELADDPASPRSRNRIDLHSNARVFPIARVGRPASHFLVYTISAADEIEVVRILHDKQDMPRHLPEDLKS